MERPGTVAVLACSPTLMITIDRSGSEVDEVHLHPGGQGFWVARMAARLGATVRLVAPLGGEPGIALRALIESEGIDVVPVAARWPNAVWVSEDMEVEGPTVALATPRHSRATRWTSSRRR
jgi:1-phosphofructokinase